MADKVSVELPEGMTSDEFMDLLTKFREQRISRSAYNTARRKAMADLVKGHKPEFEALMKKHGASS